MNTRRKCVSEDRISQLPDDILISVLSRLDDNEQRARTGLLSRRWRYLWRLAISFRFSVNYYMDDERTRPRRHRELVAQINHLSRVYLGDNIDEFSVECRLDAYTYLSDIDGWLRFAFEKRVKRLKFSPTYPGPTNDYSFRSEVISNNRVDSLTSMYLSNVGVTGEVLEHLLSVCPLLQELSVFYSQDLVDFTIAGQSLKLKYLEIYGCRSMKRLCILDVNLVTLKYSSTANNIIIKGTPHLITAWFTVIPGMEEMIPQILSQLPQLKTLVGVFRDYMLKPFKQFPLLKNVRELKLVLTREMFKSSRSLCANLLVASPFLSELKIEFRHIRNHKFEEEDAKKLEHPHRCLKVAELTGFKGCMIDLGVALYIIENTLSLEMMIIDTHTIFDPWAVYTIERITPDMQQLARALAKQELGTRLPPSTHFVVK